MTQCHKKKHTTFDWDFWTFLLIQLIPMVVICFLPGLLTKKGILDFTETGQIGDTIGGIMSPFVAMIAAMLTFMAFWIQYKANVQQREDIALERFERNVFEMLNAQEQIIGGLVLEFNKTRQSGRDVFQMIYEDAPLEDDGKMAPLKNLLEGDKEMRYRMANDRNIWFLDHYFRHLYRIYKYIDEYDERIIPIDMKHDYAGIVRSHLSPYELVLIFYNSFTHTKFRELIVKYNILDDLRTGLLATEDDKAEMGKM